MRANSSIISDIKEFLPIKEMLEDSKDEREISSVTEDYMRPIVQETIPRRDCECYNCDNTLEGVVANREELRTNKINVKSQIKDSEEMQELVNSYMDQLEKGKQARKVAKRREKTKCASTPRYIIQRTR
ncbi:hypothetical protein HanPSC8_Chr17g0797911 [Helianthus annuus]|nr:hypothetical protein HanPSC8_Chr17g0797911 [Helianthus annuus]